MTDAIEKELIKLREKREIILKGIKEITPSLAPKVQNDKLLDQIFNKAMATELDFLNGQLADIDQEIEYKEKALELYKAGL